MKKKFLYVMALAALVSCSSDEFVGDQAIRDINENAAISFGFDVPQVTRASGSDAAGALGNYFIVYGEKGETTNAKYSDGNLVFPNYTVHYTSNSAYTTTSNTKNWEYVGETAISTTNVKMYDGTATTSVTNDAQTIKYWDYSAGSYTFTAVSANKADIENGRVVIQKNTTGENNVYEKGYTITLAKTGTSEPYVYPQYDKIYFSDRQVITSTGAGANREAVNAYGGNVTLSFRNMLSQVRAGIYETINGYDVTSITFYVSDSDADTKLDKNTDNTFGAICPNNTLVNYEGNIIVTYYNDGAIENQPKVKIDGGTPSNDLVLGDNFNLSTTKLLGKISSSPTWDKSDAGYTAVLPQVTNDKKLILTVDYTLWNSVSGETIEVKGATAKIPAQYLQWKPNYKYTYLFKISDNTNGQTGTGTTPAGLYPITFDAVTVVNETGQAEYITTVSEPSITTFGVIMDNTPAFKSYVTEKNEYQIPGGTDKLDIYATFMEGSTVKTPVVGSSGGQHVNVFVVTTPDATNFPITEASVAEAIANPGRIINTVYTYDGVSTYTEVTDATTLAAGTTYYKVDANSVAPGGAGYVATVAVEGTDYEVAPKIKAVNINSDNTTYFTAIPAAVTTVPGEDGVNKTIDALKLTGVKAAGTYAIEYEASAAWTGTYTKVYKVIKVQ